MLIKLPLCGGAAEKHHCAGYDMFKCDKVLDCKLNPCEGSPYMGVHTTVEASFSLNEKHNVDIILDKSDDSILFSKWCSGKVQTNCSHLIQGN